jgi:hypothetical protein
MNDFYSEAELLKTYMCKACEQSSSVQARLTTDDYKLLHNLVGVLTEHRTSWPFRQPVDGKLVPNYYTFIKKPMGK